MTGYEDLGFARPDTDRERRSGLPEVVFAPGKTADEIVAVVGTLLGVNTGPVLVTRVDPTIVERVLERVPGGDHDPAARLLTWRRARRGGFTVLVLSAGTSDGPVAAEARAVSEAIGLRAEVVADVGVAGVHRLLDQRERLAGADAVICIAGMDGALPSVVGGLVRCPVIAVPTSVGYGAALGGVTPLLAMLSSCAAGLVVVNIDSGFGAAMAAYRMAARR
ncbi:MAG: nickel pincer cofactor biosynthesis protein LarB [Pseudonocardia sp.]|nr:nickel pincer cofactor biosynthesis protein LarB [Pseudonocardia sp.]MBO0872461.1 nickel pincer cofactor biosynthesis protein LarB [Pseudonocardia sp.]